MQDMSLRPVVEIFETFTALPIMELEQIVCQNQSPKRLGTVRFQNRRRALIKRAKIDCEIKPAGFKKVSCKISMPSLIHYPCCRRQSTSPQNPSQPALDPFPSNPLYPNARSSVTLTDGLLLNLCKAQYPTLWSLAWLGSSTLLQSLVMCRYSPCPGTYGEHATRLAECSWLN